jgi:uncharacterized protein (TIGR00725 family)
MRRRIIGVMGAGQASPASLAAAKTLGKLIAEHGWVLLTGGRPLGVMAAACAGAKEVSGSLTVGIMPSASGGVDPGVDLPIFTGMGEARNVVNVLTSEVVVACGVEGPGTTSEVALGLRAEKPVILLGASAAATEFFKTVSGAGRLLEARTPEEAVRLIEKLLAENQA